MKLPEIRFSTRRMLGFILVVGVVVHLSLTAYRVHHSTDRHFHTAILPDSPIPGGQATYPSWYSHSRRELPFWPNFWRAAVGLTGRSRTPCSIKENQGFLLERCEIEHPEIRRILSPNSFSIVHTDEQFECYIELLKARGIDARRTGDGVSVRIPNR